MKTDHPVRTAAALLDGVQPGDAGTLEQLVPLIYEELRRMARRELAQQPVQVTFQTTELVHETYLRLLGGSQVTQRGRAYFFGAAARAMRQVLIDAARRRGSAKRGGGQAITLEEGHASVDAWAAELLDLERALEALQEVSPRQVRVVECRYFGGLSVEETAEALGISPRSVKSDWAFARAWLYDALGGRAAGTATEPAR